VEGIFKLLYCSDCKYLNVPLIWLGVLDILYRFYFDYFSLVALDYGAGYLNQLFDQSRDVFALYDVISIIGFNHQLLSVLHYPSHEGLFPGGCKNLRSACQKKECEKNCENGYPDNTFAHKPLLLFSIQAPSKELAENVCLEQPQLGKSPDSGGIRSEVADYVRNLRIKPLRFFQMLEIFGLRAPIPH
jgi:hypothetical protein